LASINKVTSSVTCKKAHLVTLSAGLCDDRGREMTLAGAGVADEERVLTIVEERAPRQF
jgi:hypothetical protein